MGSKSAMSECDSLANISEVMVTQPQGIFWLDFILPLNTGLTPPPSNDCKEAAFAPPSRWSIRKGGAAKVDNLLMFSCVSAFFAGVVYAVMTLPV